MADGNFEAKVSAKRETSSGIFLTLQIQPDDYTADLATLRVGSALMVGWAEVVNTKVEEIGFSAEEIAAIANHGAASKSPKERKPQRQWSELSLTAQAGIRCADPEYQAFLNTDEEGAAHYVREYCGVKSRSEIIFGSNAGKDWVLLESKYQKHITTQRYAGSRR